MAPKNKKNAYNMQYAQEHFKQIKFNLSDIYDQDVIGQLDSVPNKQGYIKSLIRADIARAKSGKKEEEKTMKTYHIKPDYLSQWGEECTEDTVITQDELERLAAEWEKPVGELMEQLEEI